jgi:esterase/lipase superfamily enzyme
MQKQVWTWKSPRLPDPARLARWGHFGVPVLLFPTAGGDFEEVERFHLIAALGDLIDRGRMKVYSIDGQAIHAWLLGTSTPERCAKFQDEYDAWVHEEVVPRIRQDCQDERIEPILAGVSLGAFTAIANICRHPETFRAAIGLSGVYDLAQRLGGVQCAGVHAFTPASFLATLGGTQLDALRRRSIALGTGEGGYETPDESRRMSEAFEAKGVTCPLSFWGSAHDHTWATWREMLPPALAGHV